MAKVTILLYFYCFLHKKIFSFQHLQKFTILTASSPQRKQKSAQEKPGGTDSKFLLKKKTLFN